jgi:hypothetical protein
VAHSSWGPGWPNCQVGKINRNFSVDTRWGIVKFPGGVREELCELIERLVKETSNRGYRFGIPGNASYGCWGYLCRAIRGRDVPSEHSWGNCVDINAPKNPMGATLITDMPSWMPDLWNAYGFRWGGDYRTRPDAMHYEFMGTVEDAKRMTELARRNRLGEDRRVTIPGRPVPTPEPEDDKMYFLIKGDNRPEWWLTDMMTKRHMRSPTEAKSMLFVIREAGGKVVTAANDEPKVWPQNFVDNIDRTDYSNVLHETLQWYEAAKEGPLHEVIQQVLDAQGS